jgi:hypothetical protein
MGARSSAALGAAARPGASMDHAGVGREPRRALRLRGENRNASLARGTLHRRQPRGPAAEALPPATHRSSAVARLMSCRCHTIISPTPSISAPSPSGWPTGPSLGTAWPSSSAEGPSRVHPGCCVRLAHDASPAVHLQTGDRLEQSQGPRLRLAGALRLSPLKPRDPVQTPVLSPVP